MKTISFRQIYSWIIFCTPFFIWLGQYTKIGPFSLANYFVLFLTILNTNFFRVKSNKYIAGYVCFFVFMAFYAALSIFFSPNQYTLSIIMSLFTGISTMIFVGSLNEQGLITFLKSLKIFTVILVFWSIFEIFTGNYLLLKNTEFTQAYNFLGLHYPAACFPNPNDLAQFFIMVTGVVIFADLISHKRKPGTIFLTLMELIVIINTSSRMSFMCIFIFVFLCYGLCLLRDSFFRQLLFLIIPTAIIGIFLWGIFNLNFMLDLAERFLTIDFNESYVTLRGEIYKGLISLGEQHLWSGAGVGQSYIVSKKGPHNFFLFIFSDLGIFFSLGFIAVLLSLFITFCRNLRVHLCHTGLNQIMLSLLIIFPFFSSISSANEQRKALWIMLGICLAVIKNSRIKKLNYSKEGCNETSVLF